ncbi:DUF2157 domain-containing protein [Pseudaminobacter sp. NGMCC 1.201702]|uniref:DUF2157 domain-containing protein n=1 Tax=Pseudaminobacter sp. NGMCC 1.201702 TaxID=3391825 RepID=UPI0039EFAB26
MASYASRLKQDIARWAETGIVDASTAAALLQDAEANERRSFSFGFVLAIMAALLLGASILLLIAANWGSIPRLVRVCGLLAVLFGGYVGGAVLKQRGDDALAEALWLVAASSFGASIALIGQMYHFSGDLDAALLTWCVGTVLAAFLLRSGPLTVGAVAIAMAWLILRGVENWGAGLPSHLYLVIALLLWLVSYWTQSRAARHLILLSLILYVALLAVQYEVLGLATVLAIGSAALFALHVRIPGEVERVIRLGSGFPAHCLVGFLAGLAMIQAELVDEGMSLAFAALATFGGIAAALYLAGRESRVLRSIAYVGFGLELCFVYAVTMGTMLGTAGLFLASGVLLGIIAIFIIRVERRIRTGISGHGGATA